ncbi:MAG: hypothetical protein IPK07_23150 [Deltaproteobacteria bacterium]|nr:hypothetical protein [Deltaproteobacteria bacterium]
MSDRVVTARGARAMGPRLEQRILLTILPLVALMLGGMGWWSHRAVRREAVLQEAASVERALGEAQRRLDGLLAQPTSDLVALAHSALIQRYHFDVRFGFNDAVEQDAAVLDDSFRQLLEVSTTYLAVAYRDEGGGVVARSRTGSARSADPALAEAFAELVARAPGDDRAWVQRLSARDPTRLRFGTEVRDDQHQLVGKLVVDLDLRGVHDVLDGLRRGPSSGALIVGGDSTLLAAPPERPLGWTTEKLRSALTGPLAGSASAAAPMVAYAHDALLGSVALGLKPGAAVSGWTLALVVPHQEFLGRIASVGRDTLVVTLFAVGLVSVVASWVVVRISRELRIATANLEGRMEDLARAKSDLESTQAQLVQSAKLAALGELVAGVAHEMNNPLGFLYANVRVLARYVHEIEEMARRGLGSGAEGAAAEPPDAAEAARARLDDLAGKVAKLIDGCQVGAERTKTIVEKLRTFARAGEGEIQSVDLAESLDTAVMLLGHRIEASGIELHRDYGALPRYRCRAGALNQVFVNLLANALDAVGHAGGQVWISSRVLAESLEITVRDSGPGIAPEIAHRLFEPFFTTKGPTRGTGLGLSVSYGIVRDHGGTIEASNHPAGGAVFVVRLPLPPPGPA